VTAGMAMEVVESKVKEKEATVTVTMSTAAVEATEATDVATYSSSFPQ